MAFVGAEAVLDRSRDFIVKERISKGYRLKHIDEKLRKIRTRREARLMLKASEVIDAPKIADVGLYSIKMEFIDGLKLSEHLDGFSDEKRRKVCFSVGEGVGRMHNIDIIHGDLTTSNMILKNECVYFIDFGLGFVDKKAEHKAVDLHLIRQALESKHSLHSEDSFKWLVKGYKGSCRDANKILDRLEIVERRGRHKRKKN